MSKAARIGLLLLGLLAVAGVVHAPLHGTDAPCSPAGLCSGITLLGAALVCLGWVLIMTMTATQPPIPVPPPRDLRPRLTVRGRAPPQG